VTTPPPLGAEYFDQWYADMAESATRDQVQLRALGLPPELESTSLLSWDGIADVVDALAVGAGDVLVDLACGRGGYGLEVAARTGARLIGVDFSAVAIERARQRAAGRAEFRVGRLTDSGLPDASAHAVMCIDAMQFADPYAAGLAECRRILVPGGRLVLTGWQARDPADERIPARLHRDIAAELRAAGFAEVTATDQPAWREAERAYWTAAVALDPGDDAALRSMREEGLRVAPVIDRTARVLARAVAPPAS